MKTRTTRLLAACVALLLFLTGCATSREAQTTALLQQAGFKALAATTFEKQQKLKRLKPDRISTVKAASGIVYYVYPLHARNLLYAGTATEYAKYQNLLATLKTQAANLKAERPGADVSWTQESDSDGSWKDVWTAPSDF